MLIVGGDFHKINGKSRNCLAAVNAQTGELLDWTGGIHKIGYGRVDAMARIVKTLYSGGFFQKGEPSK